MYHSLENIKYKLQQPLPGQVSHLKMSTANRIEEFSRFNFNLNEAKKSAVLILLFYDNEKLKVVFIRRSDYVGIHAGQIAFPGGRYEESDENVQNTALREIEEEIGITSDKIQVIGRLTDIYVPPSNFLISIFVGFLKEKPVFKAEQREVESIFTIDLDEFLDDDVIQEKEFFVQSSNTSVQAPYYNVGGVEIWGASAMVMTELLDLLKPVNY